MKLTTIKYQGRIWQFVARHEVEFLAYNEYYCEETNEGLQAWDDGYFEIYECAEEK